MNAFPNQLVRTGGAAIAANASAQDFRDTCSGIEEFTVTGWVDSSFDGCYQVDEAYLSDYNTFSLGGVFADGPIFYADQVDGDGHVSRISCVAVAE